LLLPHGWKDLVNQPQTEVELEATGRSVARGQPYGGDGWRKQTALDLGLASGTLNSALKQQR
jgi:hypothetical protein